MLYELHNFILVAERLNFSASAEQIHIQQPALSRQISKLEDELQVKLFERTTRSVTLTDSGRLFLDAAIEFVSRCRELPERSPSDATIAPTIILGVGDVIESTLTPMILEKLIKDNPAAKISIQRFSDAELMSHFYSGDVDFVEVFVEMVPDSPAYEYVVILDSEIKVAVWKGHPLADKGVVTLDDLRNEKFIMNSALSDASRDRIYQIFSDANFVPRIISRSNDARARYMMVGARQGIAITAVSDVYESPPNVVFLDLDIGGYSNDMKFKKLVIAWNKEHCNTRAHTKQFADLLRREL